MQEAAQELIAQTRNAWRFRWSGAVAAWVIAAAGWAAVSLQPDVYEGSTRILVDTSSVLEPLLGNQIVESDVEARLVQERQKLLGRSSLEQVAAQNNLDASAITQTDRDRLYAALAAEVDITAESASTRAMNVRDAGVIFEIGYRHENRTTAAGVVNSFKDILIEGTLAGNRAGSQVSASFLERQLEENAENLKEAEDKRLQFLRENAAQLPGSGGGIQQRLQSEQDALELAEASLRQARSRRQQLESQINGESRLVPLVDPASAAEPAPGSLDARIREAQSRYDDLRGRFNDSVAAVVAAREYLDELKVERLELLREHGIEDPDVELVSLGLSQNFEELSSRLTEVELEIAALQTEINDRRLRLEDRQSRMADVLAIEQELARHDREVKGLDDIRIALEEALQRQQLSDQASNTDQAEFQIIDPPTATTEPVAPNRPLLLAGVFAGAIGGGGALSWLLAQLRPVFSSPRLLNSATGLPILGSVGRFRVSAAHMARRRASLLLFIAAMGCLFIVYAAAFWFEVAGPGLRSALGVA